MDTENVRFLDPLEYDLLTWGRSKISKTFQMSIDKLYSKDSTLH